MALLKLENVTVNYGSINALSGINLEVNEGEIVTLIGSNGAGKSTTMRTIMGLKHCDGGKIFFNGEDITNKDTRVMVQKGIILSPEGRQVFPRFSVEDNLRMGAYTRPDQEIPETMAGFFLRQLGSFIPDCARHICVCSFSADNNVIIKALHKKRKGE